jgi:DNA processing protein
MLGMDDIQLKSALGIKTLLGIKGLGPTTMNKILDKFETLGDVVNSTEEILKGVATAPVRRILLEGRDAVLQAIDNAEGELFDAREMGAVIFSIYDDGYPKRLASSPDAPLVIYTSGDMNLLDRSVACIGTRSPTEFGAAVSRRVTATLAEDGWTIVSGLARGVDSIAHNIALDVKSPTAAIIGSGIDVYSSDSAFSLVERIVQSGGVVITEQSLGKEHDPSSLIRRNRIQTGVSAATFFMQGDMESGSMHAVRYALLQGRPIYVPGIPETFKSETLNHAAINMARMPARDFGRLIAAKDSIMDAIENLQRDNVGIEIAGRDYYPQMLADLDMLVANETALSSAPSM